MSPKSLGLEDGNDTDDQPRRFLRLPSGHLLAYGGDNGNVSCLLPEESPSDEEKSQKFVVVQRYEDAIRCIAVSKDGKRIAIGFDTGKTLIHCFDDFVCKETFETSYTKLPLHPYVQALENAQAEGGSDNDFLLSQDVNSGENEFDSFAGPDLGAPARDMLFIPQKNPGNKSSSVNPYMLAIASEAGMFVIDVTSKDVMDGCDHWLEEECKESHDQCGIRGLDAGIIQAVGNDTSESSKADSEIIVLASLAMDGRLCLWDVSNKKLIQREDTLCVTKKDVGEIHDADAYDRSCRPAILCHPNKDFIVGTPGKLMPFTRILELNEERKIKILDGLTFENAQDAESGHIQPIVSTMFCSSSLLVTCGRDGRLLLWSSDQSKVRSDLKWKIVEKFQLKSPATDLCLQRRGADKVSLFSACANGSIEVFDVTSYVHHVDGAASEKGDIKTADGINDLNDNEEPIESKESSENLSKTSNRMNANFSDESDDDDSINPSSKKRKNVHFMDEAEEDDTENLDENKPESKVAPPSCVEGARYEEYSDDEDGNSMLDHGLFSKQSRSTDIVKPQPAFSPSSTPLDLTRRFLCWNHIGSVTLLQGDDNRNVVDINFADSAFKRPISFTDNINFIIGSIGESGGIFASDTKEEDDILDGEEIDGLDDFNMSERTKQAVLRDRRKRSKKSDASKPTGSSIFFYRFQTSKLVNRKNKDWHLILPDGERVLGAACGDGWAAAMTSRQFLRLFSSGGNQNKIICLKGEPVTMIGRGELLAVFYHESSPLADKTQQLGYTLWDAANFRVISRGSVSCLSKGSSLSWVGFSNDLSLMVMDTDGMLSMLITTGEGNGDGAYDWEWAPVLDTIGLRKSSDDFHWPVTVHNGKLVCIPLKGGNTYPDANRRPVTTTLGLKMPLAKSVVSKNTALEELSVRSNIALSQKKFLRELDCDSEELEAEYIALCAQVDKVTLRLYSGMVDAGKFESAFDLVSRLHSEKSFEIAIRLADRHYKLADEVERVKKYKFPDDDDFNEDCTEFDRGTSTASHDYSEGLESKQISPDSRRTEKRETLLGETARTQTKRLRLK